MKYVWLLIYEDMTQIEVHQFPASISQRIVELDDEGYCEINNGFEVRKVEMIIPTFQE